MFTLYELQLMIQIIDDLELEFTLEDYEIELREKILEIIAQIELIKN